MYFKFSPSWQTNNTFQGGGRLPNVDWDERVPLKFKIGFNRRSDDFKKQYGVLGKL